MCTNFVNVYTIAYNGTCLLRGQQNYFCEKVNGKSPRTEHGSDGVRVDAVELRL